MHAILVVTPYVAFGELIHQSLVHSNGDWEVSTCQSGEEALALCRAAPFTIAILDGDLADIPLPALGQALQSMGVRLAVFPPDNNPRSPLIAGLHAQAYLKKPFYLPGLLKKIRRLLAAPAQPGEKDQMPAERPPQPQKKAAASPPPPIKFIITDELLSSGVQLPDVVESEPPEFEPYLDPVEAEKVRQSWVAETGLAAVYTCVMVPRQPDHYLRFDLASALERWMRQISETNTWELIWLSIRPTHLEWTVRIPSEIAPAEMLEIYRHETSESLSAQFPAFAANDPGGNFWSPGQLVSPGERSLTRQQIYAFIAAAHPSPIRTSSLQNYA